MKKNQTKVIALSGDTIIIDTSEKMCKPLGFLAGQTVFNPNGKKTVILGAGINPQHHKDGNVLWKEDEEGGGKASCIPKCQSMHFISESELEIRRKRQKELEKNRGVKITNKKGGISYADPSPEACKPFGFLAGQTIVDPIIGTDSIVKGAGYVGEEGVFGFKVLFLSEGMGEGIWSSESDETNLRQQGFRLKGETEQKQKDLAANSGVKITDVFGESFYVDPSPEACKPFELKTGDSIHHPFCDVDVVAIGVAPLNEGLSGKDVLWCSCAEEDHACPYPKDEEDEMAPRDSLRKSISNLGDLNEILSNLGEISDLLNSRMGLR